MEPKDLRNHKSAGKILSVQPTFKPLKKGRLPKPFHRMGGGRIHSTDLIELSGTHSVVFIWRDGAILTDTAFYGYLLCRLQGGSIYPLFEFHWHPSHKGFHAKLPCKTDIDYTNRMLPGAPEINMSTRSNLDPRRDDDRRALIDVFCKACGISISNPSDTATLMLWN